ncbi:PilW family protein [Stenotrophomonas sp. NPDC077659]|uniref:PilW family protein n=1 Tax=Stenotrophomonas sp. NPDC077659 TaxID=3390694 RepID=UPI003D05F998
MSRSPARRQRGQSLVGVMVGLVISLLSIAAMLVMYKNMIESSGNAARAAQRDGQVASALLSAQIDLQQAGFGIAADEPLATRLAISDEGRQVVWRFKPALGQADQCAGLRLVDDSEGGVERGLYHLPPKACSDVAGQTWNDLLLQPIAGSAAFFTPTQRDGSALTGSDRETGALTLLPSASEDGYRFVATTRNCLPFGQQATVAGSAQQLSLQQSSSDVLFSVCLPNLAEPATP